jgi:hypothetical protein
MPIPLSIPTNFPTYGPVAAPRAAPTGSPSPMPVMASWRSRCSPGCEVAAAAYLNLETRSAFSRITLALSAATVPVGSPLYRTLGFDQKGMRGQPPQLSL